MKLIKQVCLFYIKKEDVVFTSVFEMYFGEAPLSPVKKDASPTVYRKARRDPDMFSVCLTVRAPEFLLSALAGGREHFPFSKICANKRR